MDLLRHLRYFVAVAEELHFGHAAERLQMAQPPLSQRIRTLERELGVQLFTRTSRRVELTPVGRALLGEARGLLAHADGLQAHMRQVRDGTLGRLRAALPPDFEAAVLAAVMRAFRSACPGVSLELSEASSSAQAGALKEGALDVGVLLHPLADAGLATGPVVEKPLGVLVPAGGDLAAREEVELGELGARTLVLFPRETAPLAYDDLLANCRAYGYVPADVQEAARREFGVGFVLATTAARDMTRLLAAIWRDTAASPTACAEMRRMLGLQVWPHRLASGFPSDAIRVSGKTGTWPRIRNEVGVVEYQDGGSYAVAVFTTTDRTAATLPEVDAVIGTTARIAVDELRRSPMA